MTEERLILSDTAWQEIATILARVKHKAGSPPKQSDRMFLEAVLYVARTGIPWRDLPEEFGHWDAVYNRFRRWEKRRVWQQLWQHLQSDEFTVAKHIFIDSTIVRAHQHAAGALKKTADRPHRLWVVLAGAFLPKSTRDV
jgi:transposase